MEFPSFNHHHHHHHHHNRYAPPPPPNNFSEDRPNFYPHHHNPIPSVHLHPPPHSYAPLPPPPPPLPVPPPPPSYNPHFTFLDAQNPSFLNHTRSSPPPRVSNQPYRFDYRTGSRSDLNRAPPEPSHRNPIVTEEHHRRLHSPNHQSENYYKPHVSERMISSSRFIDDSINDGYASRGVSNIVSQEKQVYMGSSDNHYASARSGINIDNSVGSSSRVLEDYVEKYEPRYMPLSENERIWNHHGEEDPKWLMKGKKNEIGHNDYEHESSKFNRGREGREEFKQVQKKSVLLRIGKPNNTHRNRNYDQHSSKKVESNNSNYRGKDKVKDRDRDHTGKDCSLYPDQRIEGDREGSPVDLDVSFKSNALVAKPVVTPSSPMSDHSDTQTRNRKIKRVTDFGSPLSKFSERSTGSRSSSHGFDSPSSSEKAPKQVTSKDSISNGNISSLSGPVLNQGDANGVSKAPLSFRLKKKRKLMNPGSSSFNFQLAVKDNKDVKGESENLKNTPIAPISEAIPSHTPEKIISSKVGRSPPAIVSEKDGSGIENPNPQNGFGNDCTEDKNLTPQNVSMANDGQVNDLKQQPCENEISLNLDNDTQDISADVKLSLGGTDISVTSGHDQIEIQRESHANFDVANVSNIFCNESVKMQETSTMADTNSLDFNSDEIVIVSSEKSDDQGFFDDVLRKEDESQLFEGTSNQISFNRSTEFSEDDLKESTHTVIVEDNATQGSSHKEHSFDKDAITETINSISSSVQTPSPDYREPSTDSKDDLPPSSSIVSTFSDAVAYVTDSNGKSGESMPDNILLSNKAYSFLDSQMLTSNSTNKTTSNLSIPENDDNTYVESVSEDVALLDATKTGIKKTSHLEVPSTVSSASQGSSVKSLGSNTNLQGSNLPLKKPSSLPAVPRVFAARSSPVFTNSRINKPANITKPRTWHRSPTNPAPVPLPPKQIATGQNSYIRSGNSLVRKSAPVTAIASRSSVYQLNPSGPIEAGNSAGPGNKLNNTYSRVSGSSAPVVRPKTPPLSGSTKLPDCPTSLQDLSTSPLELLPVSPAEGSFVVQNVPEDQIRTSNNSESQKVADEVVKGNKIQYVKRKSNQLVAASRSDQSIQDLDKTQVSSSADSYYKKRKNQLIRTSVGDDSANTEMGKASKNSIKRQSGISKKYKHSRFPSVWTLNSQSSGKDGFSLRQKLRPQLFPWKRSRNWGNLINISASIPSNSSSSSISRKLLLSRKRDTIYTRSKHGFSLHMSKLLSVGGSGLKWSKSIERNSKRTNEEATLAVAAAEKRKRELHGTASVTAEVKSRNNTSRHRIFRIGLVRYKMDPSRRTLQRISDFWFADEEHSTSMQSKEEIRKCYVPKRLKIGHDEYVRIGSGNQLVRNPKRRTRIFASEKVRWSLHTARSRLAKKKKFCQFFTRFGKCNKDDGKCLYIHDSSKIAVCTKFLNGLCSNPNCKLTHKVIPERMQDCSYFLQGLCSNKHCPYRHVKVSSAASVCEGFLKGYCADGNECRKKHSYACPVFEATGECPQGAKCKLHHPKNQLKRKQQNSMAQHQKNSRGRYFGSVSGEEATAMSSEKQFLKYDDVDGDMLCEDGKFAEYISLDHGNEEAGEVASEQRTRLISSETLCFDADELTKPIKIMNRVVLDSQGECDMGVS
ncbi:hypothetical protein SSX86_014724 [Deinandra increscens subsp. villosa]|uniref:C3H1-type domain-containing protein n=1 Tax=Deinandra increscens subsp. villosa TaxID=3103831 RepID=A0AAP0GZN1_9ASTR